MDHKQKLFLGVKTNIAYTWVRSLEVLSAINKDEPREREKVF